MTEDLAWLARPLAEWGPSMYIVLAPVTLAVGPQLVPVLDVTGRDDVYIEPARSPAYCHISEGEGPYVLVRLQEGSSPEYAAMRPLYLAITIGQATRADGDRLQNERIEG